MSAYSQLLNWHVAAAALSGVLAVVAMTFYICGILRGGETRPNAVSFFLWTVLQAIALVAQIRAGASLSVVLMFLITLDTAIITVLALVGYGYRKYGKIDLFCFVLAVVTIVLWQVTGNPVLAIVLAIVGDFFASFPTTVKTYREPRSEHLTAWALITAAPVFSVLSADRLDVANLAFPVYLVVMNGTIFSLAYFGRKSTSNRR